MKEKLSNLKNKWMELAKEKKSLVLIGSLLVVALIILIVFLIINANKDKYKEYYDRVEKDIVKNVANLKAQYINDYLGTDIVFDQKKFETKKMSNYEVLSYVTVYLFDNNITDEISEDTIAKLEGEIDSENGYIIYKGKTYRDYASRLLNINLKNTSVTASDNEIFDFKYVSDEDVYIVSPSKDYEKYVELQENNTKSVNVAVIESVSTMKTIKTTIAVAYVDMVSDDNGITFKYYKDKDLKDLVFEVNAGDLYILNENDELIDNPDVDTLDKHKNEFNKYVVTSTKNGDNFPITSIQKK